MNQLLKLKKICIRWRWFPKTPPRASCQRRKYITYQNSASPGGRWQQRAIFGIINFSNVRMCVYKNVATSDLNSMIFRSTGHSNQHDSKLDHFFFEFTITLYRTRGMVHFEKIYIKTWFDRKSLVLLKTSMLTSEVRADCILQKETNSVIM